MCQYRESHHFASPEHHKGSINKIKSQSKTYKQSIGTKFTSAAGRYDIKVRQMQH